MNGASGRFTLGGNLAKTHSLTEVTSPLELACQEISTHLGISADEIFFVGEGPLAHTLALAGLPAGSRQVSAIERAELLAQANGTLSVSPLGHLLESATEASTYSLGWVNGEIGSTQAIDSWAARIHQSAGLLHSDLSYGLGVLPIPRAWDIASIDARAFGGPTLGILAIKSRTRWSDPLPTLSPRYRQLHVDERLIVEAAAALATYESLATKHYERLSEFNRDLRAKCAEIAHIDVAGDPAGIPHIITFSVLYAQGEELVRAFAKEGFEVASGSACMSTNLEPSHVLVATGRLTHGNVRLIIPYDEPADSLARFIEVLPRIVEGVRQA
jgi:cysteine desulfurase